MPVHPPGPALGEVLAIVQPLAAWLVRAGVGHREFANALKPVFLAQAQAELTRLGRKPTDTTLSLLSGLHRKDVREFRGAARGIANPARESGDGSGRPSPASQVITRWLSLGWPDSLPIAGSEPSFEALAQRVSKDFHARALLDELCRLGVATEKDGTVRLRRAGFVPDPRTQEARQLMAGSVADHLAAGVQNLHGDGPRRFLEQSVFADGLSDESVSQLQQLANALWADALRRVTEAAVPLCERDAGTAQPQRFRLGMFSYSAPERDGARGSQES